MHLPFSTVCLFLSPVSRWQDKGSSESSRIFVISVQSCEGLFSVFSCVRSLAVGDRSRGSACVYIREIARVGPDPKAWKAFVEEFHSSPTTIWLKADVNAILRRRFAFVSPRRLPHVLTRFLHGAGSFPHSSAALPCCWQASEARKVIHCGL